MSESIDGYEKMEMAKAFDGLMHIVKPLAESQFEYYKECLSNGFTEEQAFESSLKFISGLIPKGNSDAE